MHQPKIISGSAGFGRYLTYTWLIGFVLLLLPVGLLINLVDLGYEYVYKNYLSNTFIIVAVFFSIACFLSCLFLVSTKNYSFEFAANSIVVKSYVFVRTKEYTYQDIECIHLHTGSYKRDGGGNISIDVEYKFHKISTSYFFEVSNFGKDELKAFVFELKKRSIPYTIKD